MKKFFVILGLVFVCITAFAHSVEWYVDGSLYQTTTCEAGDNITPPTAPTKYGYSFAGWEKVLYTELEYIESTGTQYIDTGIAVSDNNSFSCKAAKTGNSGSILAQGNNNLRIASGSITWYSKNYHFAYAAANDVFHTFECGFNYLKVDGNDITGVTDSDSATGVNVMALGGDCKVSYLKIYDSNNVLVRNLIPAKRNSDNEVGMYDTVTNTFFTNAGTGEFIAGPEVGSL